MPCFSPGCRDAPLRHGKFHFSKNNEALEPGWGGEVVSVCFVSPNA
jgi:hypothetical protein